MSRRYHINPDTGVPSICRAVSGRCPYGGDSGNENHFNTYSEAQKCSQEVFENTYRLLPASISQDPHKIMEKLEEMKRVKAEDFKDLPTEDSYEIAKAIMYTKDENIVMGVIDGELYGNSEWTYVSVALQNENISKKFLNEALFHYPKEVDEKTRRWLALNKSLTHEQLVSIINNEDEDMIVRTVAVRNPNLDKDYIAGIIDGPEERIERLPYSMLHYTPYANKKTNKIKYETVMFSQRKDVGISKASSIAMDYNPWEHKNRKRLEEESKS